MQEIVIGIWHGARVAQSGENVDAYIKKVARNQCRVMLQKRKRQKRVEPGGELHALGAWMSSRTSPPGPRRTETALQYLLVGECLKLLSNRARRMIELWLTGMNYTEVAQALGEKPGNTRACIVRALRELRMLYEEPAEEQAPRKPR